MQDEGSQQAVITGWRARMHEVIYEADTPAGQAFDILLIATILISIVTAMLLSVKSIADEHGVLLYAVEWAVTILFTVEYVLRLLCVGRPLKYATSFFGVVDLLAVAPTYLGVLIPQARFTVVIRALRLLRMFRVLKLARHLAAANQLMRALHASRRKIAVFVYTVLTLVVIIGAAMYVIEGEQNGFTSIPRSMYWAIVTLTTVGYGDLSPQTPLGQALASLVMILGYGIIAVPTGIITVELGKVSRPEDVSTRACPSCSREGHDPDARHCKFCGALLAEPGAVPQHADDGGQAARV